MYVKQGNGVSSGQPGIRCGSGGGNDSEVGGYCGGRPDEAGCGSGAPGKGTHVERGFNVARTC